MTQLTVIGGDDIAITLERILVENVPLVQQLLGRDDLGEMKTWQQVPTAEALAAAQLPAAAIVAPRMGSQATRGGTVYDGTWQVSVAVFARAADHAKTQGQIQAWAKIIRVAALLPHSLGGLPVQLRWVGEEYDLRPEKDTARTLGGCEVFFDAVAESVMNLSEIRNTLHDTPVVIETQSTVTTN